MKKVNLTVNGHKYEVEIEDLNTSPIHVVVNGTPYQVEIDTTQNTIPNTPAVINPVLSAVPAVARPVSSASANSSDVNTLRAPMPGLILDVSVKAGDKVIRGQHLLALEAMKMKNSIKSPREGIIASVAVNNGQKVAYNDLLISFE